MNNAETLCSFSFKPLINQINHSNGFKYFCLWKTKRILELLLCDFWNAIFKVIDRGQLQAINSEHNTEHSSVENNEKPPQKNTYFP